MPTPIEILLDPISLSLLAIYLGLIVFEALLPGQPLKKVKGWLPQALIVFVVYFFLSSYLPLVWDKYLAPYQIVNLEHTPVLLATFIAVLVFELMVYVWHRALHSHKILWRVFHQMHHSAERLDIYGAYYFSPLDMVGFTFIGSLTLTVGVGLAPEAVTWFLMVTMFLGAFQHANVKTPQWLGYFIQRPESHSIHHQKGIHRHNYSDLPIFDIIFGTFKNPKNFSSDLGFHQGSSGRYKEALLFKDITRDIAKN